MEKLSAKRLFILQPYYYALKSSQTEPSRMKWHFFLLLHFCFLVTLSNSFWLTSRVQNVPNVVFVVDSGMRLLDYIFNRFNRLNDLTLKGKDYNLNFSIKLNSLALIIQIKCCVLLKPLAHMHTIHIVHVIQFSGNHKSIIIFFWCVCCFLSNLI